MILTIIDTDKRHHTARWNVETLQDERAKRIIPTIEKGNVWMRNLSGQKRIAKIINGKIIK